jgi:hypothetical protein
MRSPELLDLLTEGMPPPTSATDCSTLTLSTLARTEEGPEPRLLEMPLEVSRFAFVLNGLVR